MSAPASLLPGHLAPAQSSSGISAWDKRFHTSLHTKRQSQSQMEIIQEHSMWQKEDRRALLGHSSSTGKKAATRVVLVSPLPGQGGRVRCTEITGSRHTALLCKVFPKMIALKKGVNQREIQSGWCKPRILAAREAEAGALQVWDQQDPISKKGWGFRSAVEYPSSVKSPPPWIGLPQDGEHPLWPVLLILRK